MTTHDRVTGLTAVLLAVALVALVVTGVRMGHDHLAAKRAPKVMPIPDLPPPPGMMTRNFIAHGSYTGKAIDIRIEDDGWRRVDGGLIVTRPGWAWFVAEREPVLAGGKQTLTTGDVTLTAGSVTLVDQPTDAGALPSTHGVGSTDDPSGARTSK